MITNQHVVDGARHQVTFSNGKTYRDGRRQRPSTDIASKVAAGPFCSRSLADSSQLEVGDGVRDQQRVQPRGGHTGMSGASIARSRRRTTSPSTRSRPTRRSTTATRAGHLLDLNGKVISVAAVESESGGNDGVGFASRQHGEEDRERADLEQPVSTTPTSASRQTRHKPAWRSDRRSPGTPAAAAGSPQASHHRSRRRDVDSRGRPAGSSAHDRATR